MSAIPFLVAQFCDDIRQEVGNKMSLMGCYGGDLIVESMPVVLPKLCAQVRLTTPLESPFERAAIRAELNGEVVAELELPVQQLNRQIDSLSPDSLRLTYGAVMTFSPFVIEKEGELALFADTDKGLIRGSRLRLRLGETYRREAAATHH